MPRDPVEGNEQNSYFADSDPRDPMPDPIDVVVGNAPRRPEPTGEKPATPPTPAQVRVDRRQEPEPPPQRQPPRPPAPPSREADQASMELMRQLNWQREQTQRAELAARDANQRAAIAEQRTTSANVGMVDSAIGEAQRASEIAAARFNAALDAGDHRSATAAQVDIADTRHNLLRLQEQKAILEAEASQRAAQPPPQQRQPQQQQRQPVAFNPEMAMQNILNSLGPNFPRSADWVRNNPQWVSSQRHIDMIDAAHNTAVKGMGLVPETDAYFDALEGELQRLSGGADMRAPEPRQTGGGRPQRPPMSAPPGYASAPSLRTGESRRGGVTVHLTPEQRDHAHNVLGMTDQEYAEEFLAADEGGRLYHMGGGRR